LLKELGTGVTKIDVTADDGSVKVRLTLNLSSDDWLKLSSGENYIMAIGVKVDTQSNDDKHVEVFNNRKEIIRVKVVEDSLRA
jgi:copper(I)-binding protein